MAKSSWVILALLGGGILLLFKGTGGLGLIGWAVVIFLVRGAHRHFKYGGSGSSYEPTYDRHGRLSGQPNYGKPGPDWNPDNRSY